MGEAKMRAPLVLPPDGEEPTKYWVVMGYGSRSIGGNKAQENAFFRDLKSAEEEARIMACRYPGRRFVVLEATATVMVPEITNVKIVPLEAQKADIVKCNEGRG
jgi:hypothetical protein